MLSSLQNCIKSELSCNEIYTSCGIKSDNFLHFLIARKILSFYKYPSHTLSLDISALLTNATILLILRKWH